MAKIVTMGEIMLRLSTPNNEKFIQADEFDINYGGGEANVAVSLANYGHDAEFVSALPKNPIGDAAIATLRKYNVGTKHISRSGERVGIYFLETGSAMRASNVVYDRANSSISTAKADEFDFDEKPELYRKIIAELAQMDGFYLQLAVGLLENLGARGIPSDEFGKYLSEMKDKCN